MSPSNRGRRLLHNHDGAVDLEGELRLVCECRGQATDAAVRGVSAFAFVVAAVVGALALGRVAPRPVGLFALGWIVAALLARRWASRRRAEHGRFTFDFDRGTLRIERSAGEATRERDLDDRVAVELSDAEAPADHARWLLLRRGDEVFRLAWGTPAELQPVLFVLRRQGLRAPVA